MELTKGILILDLVNEVGQGAQARIDFDVVSSTMVKRERSTIEACPQWVRGGRPRREGTSESVQQRESWPTNKTLFAIT